MAELQFAKLSDRATRPYRSSERSAGFDLCSAYDYSVAPYETVCVKTDLQMVMPEGCYGRIAPRSKLAHKHYIHIGGGVIDSDYRGNICIILFNFGTRAFTIEAGDSVAQLICEKIEYPQLKELKVLDDTRRGGRGVQS